MCSSHVEFLLTITLTVKFRSNLFGVYYKLEETWQYKVGQFQSETDTLSPSLSIAQKLKEYRELEQHRYFCNMWDFLISSRAQLHTQQNKQQTQVTKIMK